MRLLLFLLMLTCCLAAQAQNEVRFLTVGAPGECQAVPGDDRRWAIVKSGSLKPGGCYCLLLSVPRPQGGFDLPALKVSLLGSYHLYWNGSYLDSNGVPARVRGDEVPGRLGYIHLLPPHDIRQSNVLLISLSTQHLGPRIRLLLHEVRIGDYKDLIRRPLMNDLPVVAASGVMLIMAVYMLIVYLLERGRPARLMFSLLCGLFALMLVTELWKELFGYDYDKHVLRLRAILILSFTIGVLLPCYYALFYQWRIRYRILGSGAAILAAIGILIDNYDIGSFAMLLLGMGASLAICFEAWRKRAPFSGINLGALSVLVFPVLIVPVIFADRVLYLMFPVLALGLLLTLSLEHRQHRLDALRAARLENDLLRHSLQPHFLMNSLTMVMEWIEQCPPKAVGFIDALADEFRQLNACADKRLIALSTELQLCRSYLAMMSYRKNRQFTLEANGTDPFLPVPPALLHTLIENAFSHNRLDYNATFTLSQHRMPDMTMLRLDCPHDGGKQHDGTGLGLAYIRARLDDAFGRHWEVRQECGKSIWRTEIAIANLETACVS